MSLPSESDHPEHVEQDQIEVHWMHPRTQLENPVLKIWPNPTREEWSAEVLEDVDSGHMEYVLWDPTHTERWQYHEIDLEDCFWDTELSSDEAKPVMNDQIREIWERVRGQ